ncbi:glycoside hydrolase family 127 protein [Mucilaginibacter galii]|uniref:Glycosyl hydrolase n=1 Tax=Mucilaginibacter galii TaxID=2005073 RepID=A0A917N165_9SPHI|nr:glycoside hydrolase family 127 protein [Mucilaginibacter galii]GGI50538.1 glycosyl hydrolase [Mucilaginibacter galii]
MHLNKLGCTLALALSALTGFSQVKPLEAFPLSSVHLLESPFKQAQQTDMKYMLALNPDRLLAPYRRDAGIETSTASYGNWENTGLDGHIGGHYLSALSLMYASTGNAVVKQRLDYMITELQKCQQKNGNGYVGGIPGGKAMWKEIEAGNINANSFSLNGKWVPLYNIHKLYSGLYDAWAVAGNATAKDVLIKLTDWFMNLTANLSEKQIQQMLRSEHGGLNEAFANVYAITGNKKYLELARKFSHQAILNPLLQDKDALNGIHANTQIPKVIGYERIAQLSGDTSWSNAATFFWNTVVNHRTVAIGGNSVQEHFNPANNFSSMIESREGPETCNSYNMLKLTKELFLSNPSGAYMDYYERTLYNHILSSQRPEGGFVYFTPMRPGHYKVYSQPQEGFWCCVGSGLENHGKYGELIYAHQNKDLFVNLFIASSLKWKEKGLTLLQETAFPYSESSKISLKLNKPSRFAMHFRYPSWVEKGKLKINVNGKDQPIKTDSEAYASVERTWKTGDVVTVTLPMHTSTEFLPDGSNWVAFLHGPIVLAADMGKKDLVGLNADASRMGHIASGPLMPLDEAPLIVSATKNMEPEVTPVSTAAMNYGASKLIYQEKYKDLKLVPFYTLQDTRYVVYWPFTTTSDLPKIIAARKAEEKIKQELDAQTVDRVSTGEQQPESDHNFKGEKTENGTFADRHFRNATGWFSYDLKNDAGNATKLRVIYFGREKNKNFNILVNNVLLKNVTLEGTGENKFVEVFYNLPAEAIKAKVLTVKFEAAPQSSVANVYEVRLMK